jgi:hypothetical protein
MAYNFNPQFSKHLNNPNTKSKNYKNINRNGDETPYSNPNMFDMRSSERSESKKYSLNFIDSNNFEESETKFKLDDIDNPNGWNFNELDMLGEMNFRIEDDYNMYSEIEVPSLQLENEKIKAFVYKNNEGYILETSRKYVFETFNKMIEFIDSIPIKKY